MTVLAVLAGVLCLAALGQGARIAVVRHDWIAIKLVAGIGIAIGLVVLLGSWLFSGGE